MCNIFKGQLGDSCWAIWTLIIFAILVEKLFLAIYCGQDMNLDEEVIFTLPPEPLHTNILGPGNDCLDLMELKFPGEMKAIYKMYSLKKSGDSIGGKFNGPKVQHLISEKVLEEMEKLLTPEAVPFISYLRSKRELHRVCIMSDFKVNDWKHDLFDFE